MSQDEGKKYTLKLEAQAFSYRELLSMVIDILDDINNYENIIKEKGFTMNSRIKDTGGNSHYDIDVMPWETK